MRRRFGVVVVGLVVLSAAPEVVQGAGRKSFFSMPSSQQQVRDAQTFDPYPLPDVGPIDTTVRPRGFQYPPPEATRGRWPRPGTFPRVQYAPAESATQQPVGAAPPQVENVPAKAAKVAPRRVRQAEPPMPSKPPVMDDLETSQVAPRPLDTLREKVRPNPAPSARRTRSRNTAVAPALLQPGEEPPAQDNPFARPAVTPRAKPTVQSAPQSSWNLSDEPAEGPLVPSMRTDD